MFRNETLGKVVVLGRKTMDTFPGGLPLQGRTNIVLTRNPEYQVKDAVAVHSVEELLEEVKKYDSRDVYVIGRIRDRRTGGGRGKGERGRKKRPMDFFSHVFQWWSGSMNSAQRIFEIIDARCV